jgi:DNA-binding SARP family transcriptional activator
VRLARDVDEIRAALAWAAGPDGDAMTGVRIAGALAWFWYSGVPWGEARARTAAAPRGADAQEVSDAARAPADQAALAELLYPMSGLAYFGGEPDRMLALGDRARALWTAVDAAAAADRSLGRALRAAVVRGRTITAEQSGQAHAALGEFARALADLDEAVAAARDGGERWMYAVLLMRRALVAAGAGRPDQALADYTASLPRLRAEGETWFLSLALEGMAQLELDQGALAAAAAHARESAAVLAEEPDPWFVSRALDTMAAIAMASGGDPGRAPTAARLLGAAAALRARCGAEVIGPDRARYAATLAAARAALGADFAAHWDAGAALDLAGAFALAAAADIAPPAASAPAPAAPIAPAEPDGRASEPTRAQSRAPAAAGRIEVRLFGPLVVARHGAAVPPSELTPAKVRELLLYLALHPPRTKEQIALALWPDASPAQVRNAFHVTMHQLRRALGHKDAVAFEGGAYGLVRAPADAAAGTSADAECDVEGGAAGGAVRCDVDAVLAAADAVRAADRAVEQADARGVEAVAAAGADAGRLARWRAALDLARRGVLGEGEDAGEWLAAPQARVGAAWADGMEALARLHARRGAPREAAAVLEALVAAEPLREGAHRALMACYVGAGEPGRALAHYEALAAHLAREVGSAPGRETRALADAIRGSGRAGR